MSGYLKGNRQLPASGDHHIPPTSVVSTGQIKISYSNEAAILIALTFEEFLSKNNRTYRFTVKGNKKLPIIENLLTTAGFLTTLKKTDGSETYLNVILSKSSHPWFLSRELLTELLRYLLRNKVAILIATVADDSNRIYSFNTLEQFELKP